MMNSPESKPTAVKATRLDVRQMTPDQLQQLGLSQLAYVKPVILNGAAVFAIHGADGAPMAVVEDRDLALAAIVQHEMIPALVH
ncbi:MAG: DUF1150 family protein [Acetobacteraceae bacterium]